MNKKITLVVCLAFLLLAALPALGQAGSASVRGKVVDADGNPLEGVKVIFTNPVRPDTSYDGTTNKKGRFTISGLLYDETSKRWDVTVEAEGLAPTAIDVTSRTPSVVMDKFESEIKPGQKIPKIMVGGFGEVIANLTLGPATEVAATPGAKQVEAAVIQQDTPQQSRDPWDQAVTKANAGDLEGAVPLFEKAIEDEPEDAERRRTYAQVLYQLQDYGKAARQAIEATQLAPEALDGHMVLYSIYMQSNNLAGASAALAKAREIAPDDDRVLEQTAYLAEQSGDPEQAMAAYETIVEAQPDNVNAWTALGGLYADAGRMADSETAYQKVVELNPDEAYQVFFNIGALIMNRAGGAADTKKAVDAFKKAIEINPKYAPAHQQLAFALLGTGDLAGARESLERYVELRPDAPDAADMKAMIEGLK
jgi:tetratricopeptide (TPR) repeat protein